MITIKSNISTVVDINISMLHELKNPDKMLRTCATTVLGLMKVRIHEQGLNAAGQKIGTYSPGYMKVRTGNLGNTAKTKSGKLKDAGVFSAGKNLGAERPRYNRGSDTTVILSLTRFMENDMKNTGAIKLENGYGIGYTNPDNYKKSQWCEETYYGVESGKGKIFSLTTGELEAVNVVVQNFVNDAIPG